MTTNNDLHDSLNLIYNFEKKATWWRYAGGLPLTWQHRPENDIKKQGICQIRHEKMRGVRPAFESCFDNKILSICTNHKKKNENRVDPCLVK